jgi:myo-inositol-1-phosphate synthase
LTGSLPPASGKLGVLLPGMGAVATTTVAGAMLVRAGHAAPVGSLTQMARLGPTAGAPGVRATGAGERG